MRFEHDIFFPPHVPSFTQWIIEIVCFIYNVLSRYSNDSHTAEVLIIRLLSMKLVS